MTTPIALMDQLSDTRTYAPGSELFRAGDGGDMMYIVLEGTVEIWHAEHLISTAGPRDIVGEMALIDKHPRSATALTRTGCTVAAVTQRRFLFLVHESPLFAVQVMQVMSERLRSMLEQRERTPEAISPLDAPLALSNAP